MADSKIKPFTETIIILIMICLLVGLWFLLQPGTFWERAASLGFCGILLVFYYGIFVFYDTKVKEK